MEYLSAIVALKPGALSLTDLQTLIGVLGGVGTVVVPPEHTLFIRLKQSMDESETNIEKVPLIIRVCLFLSRTVENRETLLTFLTDHSASLDKTVSSISSRDYRRDLYVTLLLASDYKLHGAHVLELFSMKVDAAVTAVADALRWFHTTEVTAFSHEEQGQLLSASLNILYDFSTWKAFLEAANEVLGESDTDKKDTQITFDTHIGKISEAIVETRLHDMLPFAFTNFTVGVEKNVNASSSNNDSRTLTADDMDRLRMYFTFLDNVMQYTSNYTRKLRQYLLSQTNFIDGVAIPFLSLLVSSPPTEHVTLKQDNLITAVGFIANLAFREKQEVKRMTSNATLTGDALPSQRSLWAPHSAQRIQFLCVVVRYIVNTNFAAAVPYLLQWWSEESTEDQHRVAYTLRNARNRRQPMDIFSPSYAICRRIFALPSDRHASKTKPTPAADSQASVTPGRSTRPVEQQPLEQARRGQRTQRVTERGGGSGNAGGGRRQSQGRGSRSRSRGRGRNNRRGKNVSRQQRRRKRYCRLRDAGLRGGDGSDPVDAQVLQQLENQLSDIDMDDDSTDSTPSIPATDDAPSEQQNTTNNENSLRSWHRTPPLVGIPRRYLCNLTADMMKDPVLSPYGHVYERKSILMYLDKHNNTCPFTFNQLYPSELITDVFLKNELQQVRSNYILLL